MYEKFGTEQFYYTSKQRYFDDKYHIKKCIVRSYLYLPDYKRVIRFENHIGELITHEDFLKEFDDEDFEDEYFHELYIYDDKELDKLIQEEEKEDFRYKESLLRYTKPLNCYKKEDLIEELNKYCPNPEKQKIYFYKRAFHKWQEIPIFFTIFDDFAGFSNGKKYDIWNKNFSINKQNLKEFSDDVRKIIVNILQEGKIKCNSLDEYLHLIHLFSASINYIIDSKRIDLAVKNLKDIDKKLKTMNEPFLANFYSYYLDDLIDSMNPKILSRCEYCGQLMYFLKDKKYCSLKTDGQDCGKKARNKRTYLNSKLKIVNK